MNKAITIRFLTPYISSITRDQEFMHSPLPLDGALAQAAYWEALTSGRVADSPTGGRANQALMQDHVTPVLDQILGQVSLGDLLGDSTIQEQVYAVSSGFPMFEGQIFVKRGAWWKNPRTGENLPLEYELQPIRKRVPVDRLATLGLELVGERGRPLTGEVETGKGVLKPIDNRITTWKLYEYVWLAEVRDPDRLQALLGILQYQGMGKKRTAGFGKVLTYEIRPASEVLPTLEIERGKDLTRWPDFISQDLAKSCRAFLTHALVLENA